MKQDAKISLKCYKIVYAATFMVLLALVRGVSSVQEIGVTLEMMLPPLAIVFCADAAHQEIAEGRWEVFQLYPARKQRKVIYRRLGIEVLFLILVSAVGYGLFLIFQKPITHDENVWILFGKSMAAVSVGIIFFGCLSERLVCLLNSLWGGIGLSVILWQVLISSFSRQLPAPLQLLGYSASSVPEGDMGWVWGKLTALALSALLLLCHTKMGKAKGIR